MKNTLKVALVGNPNTGKTSLFNQLTGLNQQVGNYPGITVERKTGSMTLPNQAKATVIDLPGTYSLNPSSADENVVTELLLDPENKDFPELLIVVSEVENLKRNLLIFTQIQDLGLPTILAVNMADRMALKGIQLHLDLLSKELKTKVVLISTRNNSGIDALKEAIISAEKPQAHPDFVSKTFSESYQKKLEEKHPNLHLYQAWLKETHLLNFQQIEISEDVSEIKRWQQKETIKRYQHINEILKKTYQINPANAQDFGSKLDRILTHKIGGYVIFFLILILIFQSIFSWSEGAMGFIESSFETLSNLTAEALGPGMLTDLITQGVIAGIGGVVIFVPQIAILFLFIALLEESGYMSRVVFLMDKIMRKFGLSGKSIVPLISGNACAIPAIMATRNIESWKERLITILVTPFTVCSARLPVYTIIIALIIPDKKVFGFLDYRSLALMLMYLLGIGTAILAAALLNQILKLKSKSYFVVEMPSYKLPMLKNVGFTVFEKTKTFVVDAGKIILSISIILWFLASFGPGDRFENAEQYVLKAQPNLVEDELSQAVASYQLENSYIGIMGHAIEPVIKPLGYDWKIGIAIITSFAAREVFVGTLSVIYAVGETEDEDENSKLIRDRMSREKRNDGTPVFDFPTGISLLFFYALAMQCIATLAIVKKETNGWKWPLIQLFFMSALAYLAALIAYQTLR
jgi:ferrous iron transport protein B